jgi:ABC-type histidine transport system ATPase subunit
MRNPKEINLTAEELTTVIDHSEELEFTRYVNIELVNVITGFILEQGSNPRLSTNPQVNQSIGPFGGEKK